VFTGDKTKNYKCFSEENDKKRHLKAKVTFIKGYGIDPARCGITWQVVECRGATG
jgi:hypothetical protein